MVVNSTSISGLTSFVAGVVNSTNGIYNAWQTMNNTSLSPYVRELAQTDLTHNAIGLIDTLTSNPLASGASLVHDVAAISAAYDGLQLALRNGDANEIFQAGCDVVGSVGGALSDIGTVTKLVPLVEAGLFISSWASLCKEANKWAANSSWYGDLCDSLYPSINPATNTNWVAARTFAPRRDPLALDLDGDGLETVGVGTNPILFDHDGDGVRTGTGWVKSDDAFLALDRNGNGTIDNGGELFGVDTVLSNGQKAANGFAALADLDSNHDGQFSSRDAHYANVKLWRDLDQDGLSDAGELVSLAAAGIASINLTSTAANTNLGNGNILSAAGTYTKTNGQT